MRERPLRIEKEILHRKKIKKNAENIWGLSSTAGKLRTKRRAE
jgi:hypothetical protein|tara:strand:+ start:257 stop:385 length:129 start_codon:yes stop_codon:yes gene_type:complete